jgi:SAM-dependent methyltransferase
MSDEAPPNDAPAAQDSDAEPATTRRPSIPVPAAVPRPASMTSEAPRSRRTSTLPGAASVPPPKAPSGPPPAPPPPRGISVPPPRTPSEGDIPGPALLPRLPEVPLSPLDAEPAPPEVPAIATPQPPRPESAAARAGSDPNIEKRRSRRTLKIPDDAVPQGTPAPPVVAAAPAPAPAAVAAFRAPEVPRPRSVPPPPPAPRMPSTPPQPVVPRPASSPAIAIVPPSAPVSTPPPASSSVLADSASIEIIRPIRIIDIGPSEPPPPEDPARPMPAASAPASTAADAEDAVEEVEPERESDPPAHATPRQSNEPEEIEPERGSDPDPEELEVVEEAQAAPKKPPPPPPKRATDPQPPSAVATPVAVPAEPRKRKPWWEDLFGDDYIRTMDRPPAKFVRTEVDFIEESLGVEKGGVILDLACGAGQHAVELASRGYSVVGYDLSLAMLARAADEAQERGQKLNFLQGDMREMAFEEMFDGVYCWSTSFGYFEDDKNVDVLRRMHRALRQGGMLLIDIVNRDYVSPRSPSLVWFEGDGCVAMDEMQVDYFTSRLRVKRTAMFEDGRSRELEYAIRLYALHELGKILHESGFKVVEVTGHPAHRGVYFGAESPRVIVLAERS